MDALEQLLTPEEIAIKLQLAKSTVYKFINEGKLPSIKIGKSVRCSARDVQATIEMMKKKAIGQAA
jgi:putative molybdopterin biosynthesis protein